MGLIDAKAVEAEDDFVLKQVAHRDRIRTDVIAVRVAVSLHDLLKGGPELDSASGFYLVVLQANRFDLDDVVALVEDESVLASTTLVDPSAEGRLHGRSARCAWGSTGITRSSARATLTLRTLPASAAARSASIAIAAGPTWASATALKERLVSDAFESAGAIDVGACGASPATPASTASAAATGASRGRASASGRRSAATACDHRSGNVDRLDIVRVAVKVEQANRGIVKLDANERSFGGVLSLSIRSARPERNDQRQRRYRQGLFKQEMASQSSYHYGRKFALCRHKGNGRFETG